MSESKDYVEVTLRLPKAVYEFYIQGPSNLPQGRP